MEEFFGTLIPILIAVVGIIASAIHKKNKQDKVKQTYPEFDEEPAYRTSDNYFNSGIKSIDDFFAQNFSEEETGSDQYQQQQEHIEEEKDEIAKKKDEYGHFNPATQEVFEEGQKSTDQDNIDDQGYEKKTYRKNSFQSDGQESIQQILKRFSNDPRQAIIMSEIINRKHY
ncbi:MAG: hypothetical protein GVY19_02885 [Bacteroidetes bacterium]|jgi:hypothetical protein|nr:hypothetical protein [Bacteroidota bacterium]